MASLAESVMSGAQDSQNQQGQTVGNAIQAYHVAATAEHARQELDMEKQKTEMAKGQWFVQNIDAVNRMSGPAQHLAIDALGPQIKQVYPGFDPKSLEMMKKDPDFMRNLSSTLQNIATNHADHVDWGGLADKIQSTAPELWTAANTAAQHDAQIKAAQLGMAQVRNQQVDLNTHTAAVKAVADDPYTKQLLSSSQNLQNAIQNFQKGGATPQEFFELQQAVRSNLGIKGQSGVSERDETYLRKLGIDAGKVNQFITGKLYNVMEEDPQFGNQILGLANMEIQNKAKQGIQQIDRNSSRYKSFYNKPTMQIHAGDFQDTVSQLKNQFVAPGATAAAAAPQPAQAQASSPTPYGQTPKEIEANYQAYLAQKAHQQAGGN